MFSIKPAATTLATSAAFVDWTARAAVMSAAELAYAMRACAESDSDALLAYCAERGKRQRVVIQSDRTIIATAERAEVDAWRYGREENRPMHWLGIYATWRECRLFDWSYLAASARRSDQTALAEYASARALEWTIAS